MKNNSELLIYMAQQEDAKKEEFAKEFMAEEGLKGKARRIKIMKIIETVGYDKGKIKTALARSTITDRIHHE
ncbi:MAG: hypothetical protein ACFE94_10650 [Candidatus Hodarchaeota archaeon]